MAEIIRTIYLSGKPVIKVIKLDGNSFGCVSYGGISLDKNSSLLKNTLKTLSEYGILDEINNRYGSIKEFIENGGEVNSEDKTPKTKKKKVYGVLLGEYEYRDSRGNLMFTLTFNENMIILFNNLMNKQKITDDDVGDLKHFLNYYHKELVNILREGSLDLYEILKDCAGVGINRKTWKISYTFKSSLRVPSWEEEGDFLL